MDGSGTLTEYIPWLHKRAGQMRPASWMWHEDLVQEGLIAMWRALGTYDPTRGALPAWLTFHAENRMREVLARELKWTGRPDRLAGRTPMNAEETTHSLDELRDTDSGSIQVEMIGDEGEPIWASLHKTQIISAIRRLTPAQQRYVTLRYLMDMTNSQIRDIVGYDAGALWHSNKNGAKWKLRMYLHRLQDLNP